jgi:hypothetical protein
MRLPSHHAYNKRERVLNKYQREVLNLQRATNNMAKAVETKQREEREAR